MSNAEYAKKNTGLQVISTAYEVQLSPKLAVWSWKCDSPSVTNIYLQP